MFFTHKALVPFGVAALLATGGAAFLAQNSAPASGQGVSLSSIDGYTISNIHYTVDPPPPPPNGPPGPMAVTSVSFDATVAVAGELPAAQGFVKLDPPPPAPAVPWTQCTLTNVSGSASSFTCTLPGAGVPVNGPGGSPIGVLDHLGIEVNQ